MNYFLSDANNWKHLLPLTFTRPVGALRVGIRTHQERWADFLGQDVGFATQPHLQDLFGSERADEDVDIDATICPDSQLADAVLALEPGQALVQGEVVIALASAGTEGPNEMHWQKVPAYMEKVEFDGAIAKANRPWSIFRNNEYFQVIDFGRLKFEKQSQAIPEYVTVIGDREEIFIEEGATLQPCVLNTSNGSIYIGKNAEIMEGSMIRGPFAMLEGAVLKMGCKVYGPTTIGPHSKMGGELNNVIIQGYSNKAHDGFLGNSVIGEWCNLGADTNVSNLKNNYGEVKVWSYAEETLIGSGLQFHGLLMGDHSKCGINTMLNTGTVVGVASNIFGGGFPEKFVPSFSWGGADGFVEHEFDKAIATAEMVMGRRGVDLGTKEKAMLKAVFDMESGRR